MLERSEEQFPELPMQWRDHGYEIDQRLSMKFLSWNLWQVRRILYSSKAAVLRRCLRRITADCIFRWNI